MKKKGLLRVLTLLAGAFLVSCSGLYDEGYSIDNIQVTKQGTTTTCIITYTDEDVSPITFSIEDGVSGKDGVSVSNITATLNDDNSTTITITFSDSSVSPIQFTIPAGQKGEKGEDGRSVTGVEVTSDEENGYTTIVFTYSDGTKSDPIYLPHGSDGRSIADIKSTDNEDGTTTVTVYDTDGNTYEFTIKTGGKTVYKIESSQTDEKYVITIIYEDGTSESHYFDIPTPNEPNKWYYGETAPNDSLGKVGDYYLNTKNGNVYIKELDENGEAIWTFMFSMKGGDLESLNVYTLYFVIDEDNGEYYADGLVNIPDIIQVSAGKTVTISSYDEPSKDGYTFAGWFTTKDNERSVSEGQLTDLTPIVSSRYFYPHWDAA